MREEAASRELSASSEKKTEVKKVVEEKPTPAPVADTKMVINKELKKELQKQQRMLQQLEEKINATTIEKNKMEAQLSDPATYSDKDKFKQTEMSYQKLSKELTQLNTEYEAAFEKVMELESKMG